MTDLFNGGTPSDQVTAPEDGTYLNNLVGEGKTYKDPELLAKGAWHKDQHIKKIELENANIRAELEKRAKAEEFEKKIVELLGKNGQQSIVVPPVLGENTPPQQPDIAGIAKSIFDQEQNKIARERNVETVRAKLQQTWGSDYINKLEQRAAQLRLTKDDVRELSATKPEFLLSSLVPEPVKQIDNSHVPPRGYGSQDFQPNIGHKTFKEWDKVRQTDRKKYEHYETQAQIMKDALALKEDFYK